MLNGTLKLHDVPDVEAHARRVITATARNWPAPITPHDEEDLLAYLISEAWIASERYDPRKTPSFAVYSWAILVQRVTDWARRQYGEERRPTGRRAEIPDLDATDRADRLGLPDPGISDDPPGSRPPALARILTAGDRERPRSDREATPPTDASPPPRDPRPESR